ncbi:type VI secretion system tube protein Hcp [Ramlibacter sp. AW1]|uniref:Type VI secretion system tube protein Hcp n=1 Tax=Ramlibacter aurantiacus TaxID=2801330 RepID=A0A936ZLR4_9BURK|nr:type VI secretion system tube protein Hcp [Ramlibacter aurantiacus]
MAVDMFLKIEGIEGESADKDHSKSIDVLAWSWGLSNSGSAHVGGGSGAGKVNVQDLSFTKYIDKASTALMLHASNGKHVDKATLTVRKAGGDKPVEYLKIIMEQVMVTSLSTGGSGGEDRLTENVTLNFAKVKVEYNPQSKAGAGSGATTYGWDIAANTKV